jgi:hypothetical protein
MKRKLLISIVLLTFILISPSIIWALGEGQFKAIATGGFGDSANSYTWGLTDFNGDVYASTVRHHLWSLSQAMEGLLPIDLPLDIDIEGPYDPNWGSEDYAEEMCGQIWRLKDGEWEKVWQSKKIVLTDDIPMPDYGVTIPKGYYPKAYGYRTLGTFNDNIYALGVGTWMPPLPYSSIVRSSTRNANEWSDVTGILENTTNIRGFVEWRDKVYVSASIPGPIPGLTGGCVVFSSETGNGDDWKQVSEIGFGNANNAEIYYITVFNDHLYASTVNYETGFEVWKTDGTENPDGLLVWTQVVKEGFGDTWNQYGMTMKPFGDYLYVGSAVGMGLVLKDGQPAGARAFDIIRIDKNDNAELVVGAYFPSDPPAGWPTVRIPLSFSPAGFGNPFNGYCWHMEVFKDWLVVGTLDMSGTIIRFLEELLFDDPTAAVQLLQGMLENNAALTPIQIETLNRLNLEDDEEAFVASQIIDYIIEKFGGADLWKTKDGINWEPVTLSGFKNSRNYGIRRTVTITDEDGKDHLWIGTGNPFTGEPNGGCEVLTTAPLKSILPKKKK